MVSSIGVGLVVVYICLPMELVIVSSIGVGLVPRNQILKSAKLIHSDCNLLSGPFAVQFSRGHVEKVS